MFQDLRGDESCRGCLFRGFFLWQANFSLRGRVVESSQWLRQNDKEKEIKLAWLISQWSVTVQGYRQEIGDLVRRGCRRDLEHNRQIFHHTISSSPH